MPLFEYRCEAGHVVELLRQFGERDDVLACPDCGEPTVRIPSVPHTVPDGMYSYAPNIGTEADYERKLGKIAQRKAENGTA